MMKKNNILIILLIALIFGACEKKDEKPVLDNQNAVSPQLLTPAAGGTYDLNEGDSATMFDKFTWSAADYGIQIGIDYHVYASSEESFEIFEEVGTTTELELSVTYFALNEVLEALEIDTTSMVYLKVSSISGSDGVDTLNSNINGLTITPFIDTSGGGGGPAEIGDSVFVALSYDDFNAATAPAIYLVETETGLNDPAEIYQGNGYQAYVYVAEDNTEIQFATSRGDDAAIYGSDGANGLVLDGNNITIATAGHYLIRTNESFTEYAILKADWGILGTAAGGWDNDTDLTFDPVTELWSIDIALTDGVVKFRANDEWLHNYGDGISGDGRVEMDPDGITLDWYGSDIEVTAGSYAITMDLTVFPYTYTITAN